MMTNLGYILLSGYPSSKMCTRNSSKYTYKIFLGVSKV